MSYGYETKEEATKAGKIAKKELEAIKGFEKKWKLRVHENMGWHFSLKMGPINVSKYEPDRKNGKPRWHVLISNEKGGIGGLAMWTPEKSSGTDPEKVIRRSVQAAQDAINALVPAVGHARWMIGDVQEW
jgi:hypothetical protein